MDSRLERINQGDSSKAVGGFLGMMLFGSVDSDVSLKLAIVAAAGKLVAYTACPGAVKQPLHGSLSTRHTNSKGIADGKR